MIAHADLGLLDGFERALINRRLTMVYQPKVDAVSGAICGFEALMRWTQAGGEPISPAIFIPLAEESGKGDRGKNADDQNDDQELDEREALLVLSARAQLVEHV